MTGRRKKRSGSAMWDTQQKEQNAGRGRNKMD